MGQADCLAALPPWRLGARSLALPLVDYAVQCPEVSLPTVVCWTLRMVGPQFRGTPGHPALVSFDAGRGNLSWFKAL